MKTQPDGLNDTTRRQVLRRGAKLAYVAPAIIAAVKVESAFAISAGGGGAGGHVGGGGSGGIIGDPGSGGSGGTLTDPAGGGSGGTTNKPK